MRQLIRMICVGFISIFSSQFVLASETVTEPESLNPIGYWKTIDDVTEKPKAIVQIWEASDKQLYGKILKIFPRPGYDQNEVCAECKGDKHNQRIVGMVSLEHLKRSKENLAQWENGKILDPKSGKLYHCNLNVAEQGKKLNVRGFIGLPLFGRSQTWVKVSDTAQA